MKRLCEHEHDSAEDELKCFSEGMLKKYGTPEAVSAALGYFPRQQVWLYKATYGLPLVVIAAEVLKAGWKMDWDGVRIEAAREGVNIDAEIAEARRELTKYWTKEEAKEIV